MPRYLKGAEAVSERTDSPIMAFTIKKRRRARDRWKNPQRVKDAGNQLHDLDLIPITSDERLPDMSHLIETVDDLNSQPFTHTAKIPKDCVPVACAMVVLCEDPKGRRGVMVSGSPSMEPFFLQDLITSGDKMLKNLIRHVNPPKEDVSAIVVPTPGEVSALKRG